MPAAGNLAPLLKTLPAAGNLAPPADPSGDLPIKLKVRSILISNGYITLPSRECICD